MLAREALLDEFVNIKVHKKVKINLEDSNWCLYNIRSFNSFNQLGVLKFSPTITFYSLLYQWSRNVSRIGGEQGLQPLIFILILYRGIALSLWSDHIIQVKFHCAGVITCYCVKHNQHVQHVNARGSRGMLPQKILKNRCSEIESEGILESIYLAIQYNL